MNWLRAGLGRIVADMLFSLPAVVAAACVFFGGVIPRQEPPVR